MNILVIGGTRFMGPYVVRELVEQGHSVTVFHRGKSQVELPPAVEHIYGDRALLLDYKKDFEAFNPDVVIDMIAYTQGDAQAADAAFKDIAQRIVAISSQDVYRASDIIWQVETGMLEPVPLLESSPLRANLYPFRNKPDLRGAIPADYDKIMVEQTYWAEPTLPVTILRLPMVYGPGDERHRFRAYLQRMADQRPAIVLETSMANWHGSYGYVENVASAIALAVTQEPASAENCIFNISEPDGLSEADLIRQIGDLVGWQGEVVSIPAANMPPGWQPVINAQQHWTTDSTAIREALGFVEKVTRAEALRRTIEWERSSKDSGMVHNPTLLDYDTEDKLLAALGHNSRATTARP